MVVHVDFCETTTTVVCVVESFLSLVPLVAFIVLGYYSYAETRSIHAYSRENTTWRHIVKLALSAILSIVSFAFILIYLLTESDLSVKTIVTWCVSCFLWIFNLVLMRKEFEKLGYTTNYLKASWILMFVCHGTLLVMGATGLNTDAFANIAIIYGLNEFFLLVIIALGIYYSDDYPPQATGRPADLYSSIASDIEAEDYKGMPPQKHRPAPYEERKEEDFRPTFDVDKDQNGHERRPHLDSNSIRI